MVSVTIFDSRIPVRGARGSPHFSNGYNSFEDWLLRFLMAAAVAFVVWKFTAATDAWTLDLDGDGAVGVGDVNALVDANGDGALSIGEGALGLVWALLLYVAATTVWNFVRSFGPARVSSSSPVSKTD